MAYNIGFNMPGFLPETEPIEAETFEEAQEVLLAELQEHKEIATFLPEAMTEEEHGILADIEVAEETVRAWDSPGDVVVDKWVYWIQHAE